MASRAATCKVTSASRSWTISSWWMRTKRFQTPPWPSIAKSTINLQFSSQSNTIHGDASCAWWIRMGSSTLTSSTSTTWRNTSRLSPSATRPSLRIRPTWPWLPTGSKIFARPLCKSAKTSMIGLMLSRISLCGVWTKSNNRKNSLSMLTKIGS